MRKGKGQVGLTDGRTVLFLFKELRKGLPSSSYRAEVAFFVARPKRILHS